MSGSDSKQNPGGFRVDPKPAERRSGVSIGDAMTALQEKRKSPGRKVATNGQQQPPRQESRAESEPEPERRPRAEPQLPSPLDEPRRPPEPPERQAEPEPEVEEQGHETEPPEGGEDEQEQQEQEGGYTVMLDGKAQVVPVSELIAGYMRSSDYTKKTQQATAVQQQFGEAFQQFSHARTQLEQRLAQFTTEAAKEFEEPIDWEQLSKKDPMGWCEKRARYDTMQEARAEQGRLAGLRQQEEAAKKQELLHVGHQVLVKAIPGWKDTATRTRLQSDMKEYAMSVGYTAQELAQDILDPRQLIVLHDAALGRQMQGRRVTPQAPRSGPTMERGGQNPPSQPTRRQQEAERAWDGKRSLDNALALVKANHARGNQRKH